MRSLALFHHISQNTPAMPHAQWRHHRLLRADLLCFIMNRLTARKPCNPSEFDTAYTHLCWKHLECNHHSRTSFSQAKKQHALTNQALAFPAFVCYSDNNIKFHPAFGQLTIPHSPLALLCRIRYPGECPLRQPPSQHNRRSNPIHKPENFT